MMNLLVGISAKICISNSNCIKTISKLSAGVFGPNGADVSLLVHRVEKNCPITKQQSKCKKKCI